MFERYHRQNGKSNEGMVDVLSLPVISLVESEKQPAHYPSRTEGKVRHTSIDERK